MARKDFLKLAFVIALTMAATTAYGSTQFTGTGAVGAGSFTPSNNVSITAVSAATGYSANSKHSSGDRIIGFSNTDAKLYYSSGAATGSVAAPAASNTYTNLSSTTGWSSL